MPKPSYSERLKDPRWQKKRLEVLNEAKWECSSCGDGTQTLHVHHGYYERGLDPWDYPSETLHVLCELCHQGAEVERLELHRLLGGLGLGELGIVRGVAQALTWENSDDDPLVVAEDFQHALGIAYYVGCSLELVLSMSEDGCTWKQLVDAPLSNREQRKNPESP